MSRLFGLSDEAWAAIEPHLPKNPPGARRVDDRRVISGNVADIRIADVLLARCRPIKRLIANRGYDANALRTAVRDAVAIPVIPGRRTRRRPIRHDKRRYRDRWRVEAAFRRLKDFQRIATRYDRLASNLLSAIALVAVVSEWIR